MGQDVIKALAVKELTAGSISDDGCGTFTWSTDVAIDTNTFYVDVSTGNVGIGTDSPSAKLDVVANLSSSQYAMKIINNNVDGAGLRISTSATASDESVMYAVGGAGVGFVVRANNYVGIGTTNPSVELDVNGDAEINGDLDVTGALSKGSGTFTIDHPLDPKNKLLQHSFVESPEMRNIYYGQATLSAGKATITLPDWFHALNGTDKAEFNYQLTPIGETANLYVSKEAENGSFEIAGDKDIKVSYQISAIRHDKFAEANRVQVEVDKEEPEENEKKEIINKNKAKGFYRHAKVYELEQENLQ